MQDLNITATYSPEDNKLRLYPVERFDDEILELVKSLGFRWAPKQKLFVKPMWTPRAEDLCIKLAGSIEPEQMTMAERAEIKAGRLAALAHKRTEQASAFKRAAEGDCAALDGQPILMGHHSQRRAERQAERAERSKEQAEQAASAAIYWAWKTAGTEYHAEHKNRADVRARRIKTLLADLRKFQRRVDDGEGDTNPNIQRWVNHFLNRLAYERSLLGEVPKFDGELTAVILQTFCREQGADKPKAAQDGDVWTVAAQSNLPVHLSGQPELSLLADDWRNLMQSCGHMPNTTPKRKSTVKHAPIINPTREQANQLQLLLNERVRLRRLHEENMPPNWSDVTECAQLTQKVFSAHSKGGNMDVREVGTDGKEIIKGYRYGAEKTPTACRLRFYFVGVYVSMQVVHLTDKPTKPLPFDPVALLEDLRKHYAELEKAA